MDTKQEDSEDRANPYSELLEGTCPKNDLRLIRDIHGAMPVPETSEVADPADPSAPPDIIIVSRNIRPARPAETPNGASSWD